MNQSMSRRGFLGGAFSLGALSGCGLLRVPGGTGAYGSPKLRFGVLTDIHIRHSADSVEDVFDAGGDMTYVNKALAYFDERGVDAVMIAGDLADKGQVSELQAVADAFYAAFPNGRSPRDGRPVEKVFVYGNHDWEGHIYGDWTAKRYGKDKALAHSLRGDYAGHYRRIFHEDYSPVFRKEIKGFTFIGHHWDGGDWGDTKPFERFKPWFEQHGRDIDPSKPFFYVQHPNPFGTCFGDWAWGHDTGVVPDVLSRCPNAVAFSGHSHYALTDERALWQGAFTSLGAGSMRGIGLPHNSRYGACSFENSPDSMDGNFFDPYKAMSNVTTWGKDFAAAQGLVVSVYDDRMVIERRDFVSGLALGYDWEMPLPMTAARPLNLRARADRAGRPAFPAGAKIRVEVDKARRRGGVDGRGNAVSSGPVKVYRIIFDPAEANPKARAIEYEVDYMATGDGYALKHFLADKYYLSPDDPRTKGPLTITMAADQIKGELTEVHVWPISSYGEMGQALKCKLPCNGGDDGKSV